MNRISFMFILCLVIGSTDSSRAKIYEYPDQGFSISLSEKWIQIPKDVLHQSMNDISEKIPAMKELTFYAFQLRKNPDWFTRPYISIAISDKGRFSRNQLKKIEKFSPPKNMLDSLKNWKPFLKDIEYGKMYYDAEKGIIWYNTKTLIAGLGEEKNLVGSVLTDKGYILIICYTLIEEYESYIQEFQEIIESVKVSEDLKYNDSPAFHIPLLSDIKWKKIFNEKLLIVVLGYVLYRIIAHFSKRKTFENRHKKEGNGNERN